MGVKYLVTVNRPFSKYDIRYQDIACVLKSDYSGTPVAMKLKLYHQTTMRLLEKRELAILSRYKTYEANIL